MEFRPIDYELYYRRRPVLPHQTSRERERERERRRERAFTIYNCPGLELIN